LLVHQATVSGTKQISRLREKLGIHYQDRSLASECVSVARCYAEREDIFTRASWPVLVELALSSTSEKIRQEFELKILAGEKVFATDIRRARGPTRRRPQAQAMAAA
jgi:hypothetical protein